MRIAMFTNNYKPYIGGVPVSIEHLAAALRGRGHTVYVFAPSYEGQEEEPFVVRYPSFPMKIVGAPVPNVLTGLMQRMVKELEIDVIHVHHPAIVGNIALQIRKKTGIPVVFTYHTRYEEYLHYIAGLETIERCTGALDKYLRWFCERCDLLIAPTPGMQSYLDQKEFGTPVEVMPTGIPKESFCPDRERAAALRHRYLGDADYLFCTVSRLAKEKNLEFQLHGLACVKELLAEKGKRFRHLMIGDGPDREALQKKIAKLGLTEEVILAGRVENREICNYQAAADAFLFTSRSETQGIVLLEAMAVGNPVVAVDATGVCDVVEDGVNGYLTGEDVREWAGRIAQLMEDDARYGRMSRAAEHTAMAYSEDEVAGIAERCYQKVCAGRIAAEDMLFIPHRYVI